MQAGPNKPQGPIPSQHLANSRGPISLRLPIWEMGMPFLYVHQAVGRPARQSEPWGCQRSVGMSWYCCH